MKLTQHPRIAGLSCHLVCGVPQDSVHAEVGPGHHHAGEDVLEDQAGEDIGQMGEGGSPCLKQKVAITKYLPKHCGIVVVLDLIAVGSIKKDDLKLGEEEEWGGEGGTGNESKDRQKKCLKSNF